MSKAFRQSAVRAGCWLALLPAIVQAIGKADTVGYTTLDWQEGGFPSRQIVCDGQYGIHVAWLYSADPGPNYPDKNIRYNFFDFSTRHWLDSGVSVFPVRTGTGMLDMNPVSHCAYIATYAGSIHPTVARDAAPGSGVFEECSGEASCDGYYLPVLGLTQSQKAHAVCADQSTRNKLYYTQVNPWCTWSVPNELAVPEPGYIENHSLEGDKRSARVAVVWTASDSLVQPGFYRVSADDGANWADPVRLSFPPAFTPGSETLVSFHTSSLYSLYDRMNRLHIVASVCPVVGSVAGVMPAEVWHWSEFGGWNRIRRAGCAPGNLHGSVGYNALYATRPTLGEDASGRLYCAWEEFDSANVESSTGMLRADIYCAASPDGGTTWGQALRITDPDQTSKRFPSISPDEPRDSCYVRYLVDLVAGFAVYSQGPVTVNPVICRRFPQSAVAIAEAPGFMPAVPVLSEPVPNPFRQATRLTGNVAGLEIRNRAGRLIRTLPGTDQGAHGRTFIWDGRDQAQQRAAPGVYFARTVGKAAPAVKKILLLP